LEEEKKKSNPEYVKNGDAEIGSVSKKVMMQLAKNAPAFREEENDDFGVRHFHSQSLYPLDT